MVDEDKVKNPAGLAEKSMYYWLTTDPLFTQETWAH